MANQGAKKRKEENARHMKTLLRIIIASNVIYLAIRIGVFYSSFTWKHWAGLILTSLAYVIPYQQLAAMAKPAYTDDGDLFDGGFDMSTGGICGYLHDVIYITCFVQISSIISEKFWYIYLVVGQMLIRMGVHLVLLLELLELMAAVRAIILASLVKWNFGFHTFSTKVTRQRMDSLGSGVALIGTNPFP